VSSWLVPLVRLIIDWEQGNGRELAGSTGGVNVIITTGSDPGTGEEHTGVINTCGCSTGFSK